MNNKEINNLEKAINKEWVLNQRVKNLEQELENLKEYNDSLKLRLNNQLKQKKLAEKKWAFLDQSYASELMYVNFLIYTQGLSLVDTQRNKKRKRKIPIKEWEYLISHAERIKKTWKINQRYSELEDDHFSSTLNNKKAIKELRLLKQELNNQELYKLNLKLKKIKNKVVFHKTIFTRKVKVILTKEDLSTLYEIFSIESMLQAENRAYLAYLQIKILD